MTIKIELFAAPGCSHCAHARKQLQRLVGEVADARLQWRAVDVVDEIDYAVKLGVLSTPAIAIDGQLAFTGLPSAKKLRQALLDRLQ